MIPALVEQVTAAEVHPLRQRVLRPGRPAHEVAFPGDDDPDTVHFATRARGEIVGIASLYRAARADRTDGRAWQLRGMATAPHVRGSGHGSALLRRCIDHAREGQGSVLWCNARIGAIGFYEAHGLQVVSEQFEIEPIGPHVVMELPL